MKSQIQIILLKTLILIFSILQAENLKNHFQIRLGKVYRCIGELNCAEEIQKQVIESNISNQLCYIEALVDLGVIERDKGFSKRSEIYFKKAFFIAKNNKSVNWQVEILRNIAFLYLKLGKIDRVYEYIKKAKKLENLVTDKKVLSNLYAVIGNYYHHTGNIEESINSFFIALDYADRTNFHHRKSTVLADLGTIYSSTVLNDAEKGEEYLHEALKEAKKVNHIKSYLAILWRLADIEENNRKNLEKALEFHNEAFLLAKRKGFRREQGDSLLGLGNIYWKKGDYQKASKCFSDSKSAFSELGYLRDVAYICEKEGDFFYKENAFLEAINKYTEALHNLQNILFIEGIWQIYQKIGKSYEKIGAKVEAYKNYLNAIISIENMRSTLREESRKVTFFSQRSDIYQNIIQLCLSLNENDEKELQIDRFEKIFEYVESSKSRALIDSLGNVEINFHDIDDKLLQDRKKRLQRKMGFILDEIQQNPFSIKQRKSFNAYRTRQMDKYKSINYEFNEITEQIKKQQPEYSSLKQIEISKLSEVYQNILYNKRTAIIEYYIAGSSFIVIVLKNNFIKIKIINIEIIYLQEIIENYTRTLLELEYIDNNNCVTHRKKIEKLGLIAFNSLFDYATYFL